MSYSLLGLYVSGLILSAWCSWYLTPIVKRVAFERNWVDEPENPRKIHTHPTPRVGGIALVTAVFVGLIYFAALKLLILPADMAAQIIMPPSVILAGGLVMATVGLYDDLNFLSFEHKFVLQVVVASIVINAGYEIGHLPLPFVDEQLALGWLGVPITLIWIVGVVNAVNLLDGMDGLAAGTSMITFGSLGAVYAVSGDVTSLSLILAITGGLAGFLYYNFNPASIFMGDSGSLFLGFLLATYSLEGTTDANSFLAFVIPIIAMGLPIMDTALTITRRYLERRPLFHPDRDHIHHRLGRKFGLGHRGTVIALYGISVFFGVIAYLLAAAHQYGQPVILVTAALGIYFLLRKLGYFRLRDLPWLIREREEFSKIRRFVESETSLDQVSSVDDDVDVEEWMEEEPSESAALESTSDADGPPEETVEKTAE